MNLDYKKMKVLLYDLDTGGIKKYSEYLIDAMKKMNFGITLSDKIDYNNFEVVHIQFEHTIFHPFGLKLIPVLIRLKLNGKKIIVTTHTVLSKKEIYARNSLFRLIKKIVLPLDEILMGILYDKVIVHTEYSRNILIKEYHVSSQKIGVVPYGVY